MDLDGAGYHIFALPGAAMERLRPRTSEWMISGIWLINSTRTSDPGTGKLTPRNQTYPRITLPADFDNGDNFFSQDLRLARMIRIEENTQLQLIGEVFNVFNIANHARVRRRFAKPNHVRSGEQLRNRRLRLWRPASFPDRRKADFLAGDPKLKRKEGLIFRALFSLPAQVFPRRSGRRISSLSASDTATFRTRNRNSL